MEQLSRGMIFVHSAPAPLCPHVEWAIGGVLGSPVRLRWACQPADEGTFRADYSWTAPSGTSAAMASALRGWSRLRFEVTEDARPGVEGTRYSYTPRLGVFHAVTGPHGDILVPEDRIRAAMASSSPHTLAHALGALLGEEWDAELEPFRYASDADPVRWLHQVV